jgi:hypothetical protein
MNNLLTNLGITELPEVPVTLERNSVVFTALMIAIAGIVIVLTYQLSKKL